MTETISLLEAGTMLLLIIGLLVTGRALYLVIGDLARLKRKSDYVKNGIRHLQAKAHIRTEARKFASMLFFLIAVGVLMAYEPRGGSEFHPASLTVLTAILFTLVTMVLDTLLYLLERDRILDMLDQRAKVVAAEAPPVIRSTVKVNEEGKGTLQVPVEIEREI